jgi:hypothetical protein
MRREERFGTLIRKANLRRAKVGPYKQGRVLVLGFAAFLILTAGALPRGQS